MLEADFTGPERSSIWLPGWELAYDDGRVSTALLDDIETWRADWERDCYFNDEEWLDLDLANAWHDRGYQLLARLNAELLPQGIVALPGFDVRPESLVTKEVRDRFREQQPVDDGEVERVKAALGLI